MQQQRHHEIKPSAQGCTVSGGAEVKRLKASVLYSDQIDAIKAKWIICKTSQCSLSPDILFFGGEEVVGSEEQVVWRINQSEQGLLNFRAAISVERGGRKAEEVGPRRVEKMAGASALLSVSLKPSEPPAFGRVAATVWQMAGSTHVLPPALLRVSQGPAILFCF